MKILKINLFSIFLLAFSFSIFGQSTDFEETVRTQHSDTIIGWKAGGKFSLQFSQVSFVNWAAGGDNSISGIGNLDLFLNYTTENSFWTNYMVVGYGMQKLKDDVTKTEDKLNFTSKYGKKAKGNWYYSGLVDIKTQMSIGYSSDDSDFKISNWFAPAYLFVALGMDLNASKNLNLFLSPLSIKSTYVLDQQLSDSGSFGLDPGDKARYEFGGYIKFFFKHEIMENISFQTKLDLFSNYLENPQNIDVYWEVILNLKVNKFISAQLTTNLIYDDDVLIPYDSTGDGVMDSSRPNVQFKELIGVGLAVDF